MGAVHASSRPSAALPPLGRAGAARPPQAPLPLAKSAAFGTVWACHGDVWLNCEVAGAEDPVPKGEGMGLGSPGDIPVLARCPCPWGAAGELPLPITITSGLFLPLCPENVIKEAPEQLLLQAPPLVGHHKKLEATKGAGRPRGRFGRCRAGAQPSELPEKIPSS